MFEEGRLSKRGLEGEPGEEMGDDVPDMLVIVCAVFGWSVGMKPGDS